MENFVGIPEDVIQALLSTDDPFEVLDRDIMCGMGANLKEMERQYGKSSSIRSLQTMLEFLEPICRL